MKLRSSVFATTLFSVLLPLSPLTSAQDIQERTIRFGFAWEASHPIATAANKFGEIVAAKSGGKLKVRVFPGNQLGVKAQ